MQSKCHSLQTYSVGTRRSVVSFPEDDIRLVNLMMIFTCRYLTFKLTFVCHAHRLSLETEAWRTLQYRNRLGNVTLILIHTFKWLQKVTYSAGS